MWITLPSTANVINVPIRRKKKEHVTSKFYDSTHIVTPY